MPKGPRGEKRPADVIGAAVKVMRIATGEETEELEERATAAVQRGTLGGKSGGPARAASLSKTQRSKIARRAAKARWSKVPEPIE
jgi:hypothetical protein